VSSAGQLTIQGKKKKGEEEEQKKEEKGTARLRIYILDPLLPRVQKKKIKDDGHPEKKGKSAAIGSCP